MGSGEGRNPLNPPWIHSSDLEQPTKLITATPLESDPVILVWDLRNSHAPERVSQRPE